MEFEITNTRVWGIDKSVVASGNSYRTEIRDCTPTEKDFSRADKLSACVPGTGHDSFLCGIHVDMDVTAPLYWWKQAQRYHWFDFMSSQSTMHCILKFDIKDRCVAATDPRAIAIVQELVDKYKTMKAEGASEEELKAEWYHIIATLPEGFCLSASMATNYRQLKTMYLQRKDHVLDEWREGFCQWVKTLPHQELITGDGAVS